MLVPKPQGTTEFHQVYIQVEHWLQDATVTAAHR